MINRIVLFYFLFMFLIISSITANAQNSGSQKKQSERHRKEREFAGTIHTNLDFSEIQKYSKGYRLYKNICSILEDDSEYVADINVAYKKLKNLADTKKGYAAHLVAFYTSGLIKVEDTDAKVLKYTKQTFEECFAVSYSNYTDVYSALSDYYDLGSMHIDADINHKPQPKGDFAKIIPILEYEITNSLYAPYANLMLAKAFFYGVGVEQSFDKYIELIEQNINLKMKRHSYKTLMNVYLKGDIVQQDKNKALSYFNKYVAFSTNTSGLKPIIRRFAKYAPDKIPEAVELIKNAKIRNGTADQMLQELLKEGIGLKNDLTNYCDNLEKHAPLGNPQAIKDLIAFYGISNLNPERYVFWLNKAIKTAWIRGEQGYRSQLSMCYLAGYGVKKNPQKAFKVLNDYYIKTGMPNNEILLTAFYIFGIGTDKNFAEAKNMLTRYKLRAYMLPPDYPILTDALLEIVNYAEKNDKVKNKEAVK